jgi:ssDNA-binding Zn-finger/Zn-ribbon topoisomerase 1
MADKLKPCPFCGSNPDIIQVEEGRFELACGNLVCGYFGDCFESYEEALLFWNTRYGKGEEVKNVE